MPPGYATGLTKLSVTVTQLPITVLVTEAIKLFVFPVVQKLVLVHGLKRKHSLEVTDTDIGLQPTHTCKRDLLKYKTNKKLMKEIQSVYSVISSCAILKNHEIG